MRRAMRCVAFTASLAVIMMYWISREENMDYVSNPAPSTSHNNTVLRRNIEQKKSSSENRREINLLFWQPVALPYYKNQLYSSDRKCQFHFNVSDYNRSEAVIFRDVFLKSNLPGYRPPGQIWIYQAWQSWHNARINYYLSHSHIPREFNYTITYSKHSDVHIPYGECVNVVEGLHDVKQKIDDIVSIKEKLAVWMVSHCVAPSLRQDYIGELSRHMEIEIYGACGTLYCTDDNSCQKIISTYKFYLAFENSLCGEYITEKLWRCYEWGLVPVVFGGLDTYKEVLPSNSYIDVAEFSSPKLLADYIMLVSSNETLYRNYFTWKYNYKCGNLRPRQKMERICTFVQKNKQQTVDMNNVWNFNSNRCEQENPSQYLANLGVMVNNTKIIKN